MSTRTSNYNLIKPGEEDFVDIKDINKNMDMIDTKMKDVENKVGAPLIAATAAEMTNKERVYVYVGSQSGYTKGNWYYWNGSSWVSGGVYNSVAVETDKTLTVAGKAADGEVVGQEIGSLKEDLQYQKIVPMASIDMNKLSLKKYDAKITENKFLIYYDTETALPTYSIEYYRDFDVIDFEINHDNPIIKIPYSKKQDNGSAFVLYLEGKGALNATPEQVKNKQMGVLSIDDEYYVLDTEAKSKNFNRIAITVPKGKRDIYFGHNDNGKIGEYVEALHGVQKTSNDQNPFEIYFPMRTGKTYLFKINGGSATLSTGEETRLTTIVENVLQERIVKYTAKIDSDYLIVTPINSDVSVAVYTYNDDVEYPLKQYIMTLTDFKDGKIGDGGSIVAGDNLYHTEKFIPINPLGEIRYKQNAYRISDYYVRPAYYDMDKNFISLGNAVHMTYDVREATFKTPKNANYMDLTYAYFNDINSIVNSEVWCETNDKQFKNLKCKSEIRIASSESTDAEKESADFVCDGKNDEEELQRAIDILQGWKGGKIVLTNGHYYIDTLTDSGNEYVGKLGIYLRADENKAYSDKASVSIEGLSIPNLKGTYMFDCCPIIQLSNDAYNSIKAENVSIIGVMPRITDGKSYRQTCGATLSLKNCAVAVQEITKNIIGINCEFAYNMVLENIQCCRTKNLQWYDEELIEIMDANPECIGVRTVYGWNYGSWYEMRSVNVRGWGTGFDISGEHLVATELCARICKQGYRFGHFGEDEKMAHPNTFINCCEELVLYGFIFERGECHPVVNFIDFNTEDPQYTLSDGRIFKKIAYAKEEIPGNYYGRITYAINSDSYKNKSGMHFWESDGSGENFVTIDLLDKLCGKTSERPSNPKKYQQYFDTDINKMIYFINKSWVDAMGNVIN